MKYDVVVIGGGIQGVGLARELALRGVSVGLFEKDDFASGTSSASSKLVHGGLRYLEQAELGLVFEACHERQLLLRNAPHLVKPQAFLIPIYKGDRRPKWMISLGLWLYDMLSSFRNVRHHRMLSADQVLDLEPSLNREGLLGGAEYFDAKMDDARLCLEIALQAQDWGAEVFNYHEVVGIEANKIRVLDRHENKEKIVVADMVINAGGPWIDGINKYIDEGNNHILRPSKGIHILVPKNLHKHALFVTAKSDGRVLFFIPHGSATLIGTTDSDYLGSPDDIDIRAEDIDYLLNESNRLFPELDLKEEQIISAFAGLRPLVKNEGGNVGSASREFKWIKHYSWYWSLTGGKYTTFRSSSEAVAKDICRVLKRPFKSGLTRHKPMMGGGQILDIDRHHILAERYGSQWPEVLRFVEENEGGENLLKGSDVLVGELLYFIHKEMAKTVTDVCRRRTQLFFKPGLGLQCAEEIADVFVREKGWSEERRKNELSDFKNFVQRHVWVKNDTSDAPTEHDQSN